MESLASEVKIKFSKMKVDGDSVEEPWQAYLRIVGLFCVKVGDRLLYQEEEFCLVEFAVSAQIWRKGLHQKQEDFIYTSLESDESGLFWVKKVDGGWRVGSIHQEYEEALVFDLDLLATALGTFCDRLRDKVLERFGVDLNSILIWAESDRGDTAV